MVAIRSSEDRGKELALLWFESLLPAPTQEVTQEDPLYAALQPDDESEEVTVYARVSGGGYEKRYSDDEVTFAAEVLDEALEDAALEQKFSMFPDITFINTLGENEEEQAHAVLHSSDQNSVDFIEKSVDTIRRLIASATMDEMIDVSGHAAISLLEATKEYLSGEVSITQANSPIEKMTLYSNEMFLKMDSFEAAINLQQQLSLGGVSSAPFKSPNPTVQISLEGGKLADVLGVLTRNNYINRADAASISAAARKLGMDGTQPPGSAP